MCFYTWSGYRILDRDSAELGNFDTPQTKGVGILASSVLSRIIANPLFGYVHKRTLPARPHLK